MSAALALTVVCPRCAAVVGERCRLLHIRPRLLGRRHTSTPHRKRIAAALAARAPE